MRYKPNLPPPALTMPQVCDYLQVGDDCLRRLIKSGQLQAFRAGRRLRVTPQALEAFTQNMRVLKETR
jgi:excisionase family DNA binding protein